MIIKLHAINCYLSEILKSLFFAVYKGLHRLFYWGIFWPVAKHQKRCLESPCGCFIPWMGGTCREQLGADPPSLKRSVEAEKHER